MHFGDDNSNIDQFSAYIFVIKDGSEELSMQKKTLTLTTHQDKVMPCKIERRPTIQSVA